MTAMKKKTTEQSKQDELLEKMRKSNLAAKMFYVKGLIKNVVEDLDIGRYKATSHNEITKAVSGPLNTVGVFYIPHCKNTLQDGNRTEVVMALEFVNIDNPAERIIVGDYTGYGIDNQDKGPGKAYSYAIKYILMKTFGILSGENEDDEVETNNATAVTKKTDEEKARDSAVVIFKDVVSKIKEMNHQEAVQYWSNMQANKKATFEFIKLNNNNTYVNLIQNIDAEIKKMEASDDS